VQLITKLKILKQLPSSTDMLSDLFAGVVATAQGWIIAAQETVNFSEVPGILGVSREMPDSFYLQVAATARACVTLALTRLTSGQMLFVKSVIEDFYIEEDSVRRLPEDFFIEVAVAAGRLVLQAFKNKQFTEVELISDALERLRLPEGMEITAHPYLEAFRTAAACIAQALRDGQFHDVVVIFRDINELNGYGQLPAELFVEVHTTAGRCVDQALRDGRLSDAISTLDVLPPQLPWVEYPEMIAIAARECIVQALKSRRIAEAKDIFRFLKKMLPPTDPSNFFLQVATTTQACIVQALHNSQFSEAESILEILAELPAWLYFGPHIFVETATMLGRCVIEAITDKRLEDARRVFRFFPWIHPRREKCHACCQSVSQLEIGGPARCMANITLRYFDIAYPPSGAALVKDTYKKFSKQYPRELYQDWEERKFDDGSSWKKEYVSQVKASPIFHGDIIHTRKHLQKEATLQRRRRRLRCFLKNLGIFSIRFFKAGGVLGGTEIPRRPDE
jgi:hypothetical protein